MVERKMVGSGVSWEEEFGYSRAVRVGDRISVFSPELACRFCRFSAHHGSQFRLPSPGNFSMCSPRGRS